MAFSGVMAARASATAVSSVSAVRAFSARRIGFTFDYSRKRFGLFVDGCPNLLWELMRTRREQLTAAQLMRNNPTEAIVDKDNHLRDALKYILLSLPSPSEKPHSEERDEIIGEAYATGNYGSLGVRLALHGLRYRRRQWS